MAYSLTIEYLFSNILEVSQSRTNDLGQQRMNRVIHWNIKHVPTSFVSIRVLTFLLAKLYMFLILISGCKKYLTQLDILGISTATSYNFGIASKRSNC